MKKLMLAAVVCIAVAFVCVCSFSVVYVTAWLMGYV